MRLLLISLASFCSVAIVIFSILPIDLESLGPKWSIIIVFIFSSVRVIYYRNKLFFLRAIAILTIIVMLYYWRFDLNLARSWIPQMVMYENIHIQNRKIELQTKETGEWPRKRIVDRFSLLPYIYWKGEMDEQTVLKLDTLTWKKVNHRMR
jgi:hypothetical protein